jgi:hypothetical protein
MRPIGRAWPASSTPTSIPVSTHHTRRRIVLEAFVLFIARSDARKQSRSACCYRSRPWQRRHRDTPAGRAFAVGRERREAPPSTSVRFAAPCQAARCVPRQIPPTARQRIDRCGRVLCHTRYLHGPVIAPLRCAASSISFCALCSASARSTTARFSSVSSVACTPARAAPNTPRACVVAASAASAAASAARCFGRIRRSQAANASTSASPAARLVAASVSRSIAA